MGIEMFLILAPLILIFLFKTTTTRTKKRRDGIVAMEMLPGPKRLPIIGNLHQLGKLPHRSLLNLSKTYGDLMFLKLGSVPTLVVSSPNMAREIFRTHDLVFSGRPNLYAAKRTTYNFSAMSFSPYGEYWRDVRKIVVLELMTPKRVHSFGRERVQEVALMVDRIASSTNPFSLSSLAFTLSNSVMSRVVFGSTGGDIDRSARGGKVGPNFEEIFREMQHLIGELNVADYFPWMAWVNKFNGVDKNLGRNFRELDMFLDKVLEEHLNPERTAPAPANEDIVDVLLRSRMNPNQDLALTNEQMKGVLTDIFLAGTDTSSATIIWTMAELIRNPRVMEHAQQEIREIVKDRPEVEEADLPKLEYLKMVIKESFRLHPPAPLLIPRVTLQNCTIGDKYEIPAGTRVIFNAAAIQTDPKYWEDPEKYCPGRFLGSQIDFRGQHFELLPFGAGRRGCPGINFATPLIELALANLLFRFNWKLPQGMSPEDVDMEEALGITMHKKIPLCLVASPAHA